MRAVYRMAAALLAASPAAAAPTAAAADMTGELQRFDAALIAGEAEAAARIAGGIVEARRPADKALRTDPILNAVLGRLALTRGAGQARAFLERVDLAALPAGMRPEAGLAIATARELTGDYANAEAALGALNESALNPEQQRRRTLARARIALMSDPARARALVAQLAANPTGPAERWEAPLIDAAALALLGDVGGARAASGRAWADALDAPAANAAPVRVALVRAAIANTQDERIAMFEIAKAADNPVDGTAIVSQLPPCGSALSSADYVTFSIYSDPGGNVHLLPLRASRSAAIAPFARAIRGGGLFASTSDSAGGNVVTLRCRTLRSADYKPDWAADPQLDWFIVHGLYASPDVAFDADVARLDGDLAVLSARYGADSPRLLPTIDILAGRLLADGDEANAPRVEALQNRFRAIVKRVGGADDLMPTDGELAQQRAMRSAAPSDESKAKFNSVAAAFVGRLRRDQAYQAAALMFAAPREIGFDAAVKRRVAENLLPRFPASEGDPRRAALLVRLAGFQRSEDETTAAQASLRAAGAPPGFCGLADELPQLTEMRIEPDDYPPALIQHKIEGVTAVEYDLRADGRVAASRILLSSPARLFDETVTRELGDFEFEPAVNDGKPVACRGDVQSVKWRLPTDAGGEDDHGSDMLDLIKSLEQPAPRGTGPEPGGAASPR